MKQATPTRSTIDRVRDEVVIRTPESIIEAIATIIDRRDECKRRIDTEGIVVRDLKGSVIAHPAIKIEQESIKMLDDLMAKHKKR